MGRADVDDFLARSGALLECGRDGCSNELTAESPSADFCGPDCQQAWHESRTAPVVVYREADTERREYDSAGLWQVLHPAIQFEADMERLASSQVEPESWVRQSMESLRRWAGLLTG